MNIEEVLKGYILSKYKSINGFSHHIGIAYGTVSGVFTRGITNSSIKTITGICDGLNISIDELIKGRIVIKDYNNKLEFDNSVELLTIFEQFKNHVRDNSFLLLNGYPIEKNDVESILTTIDISLEMIQRKYKE